MVSRKTSPPGRGPDPVEVQPHKLEKWMEKAGLTTIELAVLLGLSADSKVRNWLSGRTSLPGGKSLGLLLHILETRTRASWKTILVDLLDEDD